jgi:uncharacterized protein
MSFAAILRIAALVYWLLLFLRARVVRGASFARFAGAVVGVYVLLALGQAPSAAPTQAAQFVLWGLSCILHVCVFVHFWLLARPRYRGEWYRKGISLPASYMAASMMLGLFWSIAGALHFALPAPWLPYLIGALGFATSLRPRQETVTLAAGKNTSTLTRVEAARSKGMQEESDTTHLRIAQLTDTHIGPFMSKDDLRRIVERSVASKPDLVLLTGDFLTMESQSDPALLTYALAPLAELEGRVIACYGNHDYESPEVVDQALDAAKVITLRDQATEVLTRLGPVALIGFHFRYRGRKAQLTEACAANPRASQATRIALLHDPHAIVDLPDGQVDYVFSGHMHGGQIGLVSLGLNWTFAGMLGALDHGVWHYRNMCMYLHRGTGHYGFPIRLGVPAEESIVRVPYIAS